MHELSEASGVAAMPARVYVPLAAVVGMLCGLSASSIPALAHSWAALAFWGIAGLILGAALFGRAPYYIAGPIFGLALSLAFLVASFQGSQAQVPGFIVLCVILGILGALCGLALLAIGALIVKLVKRGA